MTEWSLGLVIVALIGFAAFNLWLRQQRRLMAHRERLAALEKGIELPADRARPAAERLERAAHSSAGRTVLGGDRHCDVCRAGASHPNAPPIPPPGSGVQYWQIPAESFIPKGMQAIGLLPLGSRHRTPGRLLRRAGEGRGHDRGQASTIDN